MGALPKAGRPTDYDQGETMPRMLRTLLMKVTCHQVKHLNTSRHLTDAMTASMEVLFRERGSAACGAGGDRDRRWRSLSNQRLCSVVGGDDMLRVSGLSRNRWSRMR